MPSPDDSFYNIKRLHVVFALSSAALLGVTVWMLAADHYREWKGYQRTFRERVEPWLTEAQIRQEETDGYAARQKELEESLVKACAAALDPSLIERFRDEVARAAKLAHRQPPDFSPLEADCRKLAAQPGEKNRRAVLDRLREFTEAARLRAANFDRELRFRRADFDEARSTYEAWVGQGLAQEKLTASQQQVERARQEVARLTAEQEAATAHCDALAGILGQLTRQEDAARQALADHGAQLERMRRALDSQSASWKKDLLNLPLIDALGSRLSVNQVWLPELTIDYNFRGVARFDRCTTCHLGMDKTRPGEPSEPACLPEETLTVHLVRPSAKEKPGEASLESIYGLAMTPHGMLDRAAATVGLVLSRTAAADALLLPGDVILAIDGQPVRGRDDARARLMEAAAMPQSPGESSEEDDEQGPPPIELKIRRGLPRPYGSHPRLDLFVGSLSPHPLADFGCTICHDGQGSATEFKFASHTPNRSGDRRRWQEQYDWYWNKHWDVPMRASRFSESSCLRCHHDVTDLEPTDRFPDPPAPKLLEGYHLVRRNGCFGCHEIKGVLESGERVGPDMRLEPRYHEAAEQLLASNQLDDRQQSLARQVIEHPEDPQPRRQLATALGQNAAGELGPEVPALLKVLAAGQTYAGTMRKVGPSLRDTASKVSAAFIESWIANPSGFRPETRMPHFFGLHEHLEGKTLEDARRFEAVEIRAIREYLLSASQPVPPLEPPPGVTEPPSAERGKSLFLTKGCAACHKHQDFPDVQSVQGPDLTGLGSKITTETGRKWLVSWIRNPVRHSPRTLMPNALLEPIPLEKAKPGSAEDRGNKPRKDTSPRPRMTDPAADIAAYLLAAREGPSPAAKRIALVERDLDELALMHLSKAYPTKIAQQYLADGIPERLAGEIQGDARELFGPITPEKKLRYVGRRTIRKRGCFGCHDIPGFEDAQPIGPALSDWGRKQESLLAFNQVHRFLDSSRHAPRAVRPEGESGGAGADAVAERTPIGKAADGTRSVPATVDDFYLEAIRGQRREGFLWQKLRAPRSFDYKVAENKPYNEQLTMGRFTLTDAEREAIMTFVLGLVADPPAEKYVYQPEPRRRAIVEGRKVLDKYGCAECHTLQMERWKFQYDPKEFEDPFETPDFEFVKPQVTAEQLARSLQTDRRGLGHAEVVGMPRVDQEGKLLEDEDDDGNPLYFFTLWEPAVINGKTWTVGGADVMISRPQLVEKRPPWGGAFARLLYPSVLQQARASGSSATEMEAWGWVPPPLVHEGAVVEPAWLHGYLLNPVPIRPSTVLRMPQFHLSPDEASKLVDSFAAVSGAEFPYTTSAAGQVAEPSASDAQRIERLDKAMRLVIDRTTYCAKCHLIGDYSPGGDVQTILAPNLERVGRRIRPEYLRRWLANPKSVLPYTGMPVNFPPQGPPMGQDLYEGSSQEQLDAVSDLLLNYDWYLRRRTSIQGLIEAP